MLITETLTKERIQYIESGDRRDSCGIQTISHKTVPHFTPFHEEDNVKKIKGVQKHKFSG